MVKRVVSWELYIFSAVLTTLILMIGFYIGILLSKSKIQELEDRLMDLRLKQDDTLVFSLLDLTNKNVSCELLERAVESATRDAAKLGEYLTIYEDTEKVSDESFYDLKKDYTLTLIRYWVYMEEIKKICNRSDIVTVIYFYANDDCADCPSQGRILTYMKQKYPSNLMVYAIDYNIGLNTVDVLKEVYGVSKVPSLVINGEKHENLVTLEQLQMILCSKHKLC